MKKYNTDVIIERNAYKINSSEINEKTFKCACNFIKTSKYV